MKRNTKKKQKALKGISRFKLRKNKNKSILIPALTLCAFSLIVTINIFSSSISKKANILFKRLIVLLKTKVGNNLDNISFVLFFQVVKQNRK